MITLAEQKNSGNEAITRIDLIRESKTSSQIALYVTFTGLRGNSHQNENCRNIIAKVCRETEAYMLTADSDSGFRMRSRTRIACFIIASFFFLFGFFRVRQRYCYCKLIDWRIFRNYGSSFEPFTYRVVNISIRCSIELGSRPETAVAISFLPTYAQYIWRTHAHCSNTHASDDHTKNACVLISSGVLFVFVYQCSGDSNAFASQFVASTRRWLIELRQLERIRFSFFSSKSRAHSSRSLLSFSYSIASSLDSEFNKSLIWK